MTYNEFNDIIRFLLDNKSIILEVYDTCPALFSACPKTIKMLRNDGNIDIEFVYKELIDRIESMEADSYQNGV